MLSRKEMIELLAKEYGIHNEKELEEALVKLSVKFTFLTAAPAEVCNGKENIQKVS